MTPLGAIRDPMTAGAAAALALAAIVLLIVGAYSGANDGRAAAEARLDRAAAVLADPALRRDPAQTALVLQTTLGGGLMHLTLLSADGRPLAAAPAAAPPDGAETLSLQTPYATLIAAWQPEARPTMAGGMLPLLGMALIAVLGAGLAWRTARRSRIRQLEDARGDEAARLQAELQRQRDALADLTEAYNQLMVEHAAAGEEMQLERRRFFDDIEQQKAELLAARDAAMSEAMTRSRFFAGMTHELRTPMNAIMGFSEAIENQIFGPDRMDRYSEYAHDIRISAQHLLDTINQLLDMGKAESGKLELEEQDVDVAGIVEDCAGMLRRMAEARGVRLEQLAAPNMPPYRADKRILRQILINLISNAVKFSEDGGRVIVEAAPDLADDLQIRVRDRGKGIAEEDIAHIFEPYVQGRIKGSEPGTGLGLPLSRTFARLHGGELTLESEEGEGTVAILSLPSWRWRRDGNQLENADRAKGVQQVAGGYASGSRAAQAK